MQLHTFDSPQAAKQAAAEALALALQEAGDAPVLFLSSGGSALGLLDLIPESVLSSRITMGMTDDRFSLDPAVNNFAQATQTAFYARLKSRGGRFISTLPRAVSSLQDTASAYEASLREWRALNPTGKIVATVGIGPDGHTIGVLPFPEDETFFADHFMIPSKWVVGYDATGKTTHVLRITLTLAFLMQEVTTAIVYAVGSKKKSALEHSLSPEGSLAATPGRVVLQLDTVSLFTDVSLSP